MSRNSIYHEVLAEVAALADKSPLVPPTAPAPGPAGVSEGTTSNAVQAPTPAKLSADNKMLQKDDKGRSLYQKCTQCAGVTKV